MAVYHFHLLHMAVLVYCVHGRLAWDSICASMPDLQILDKGIEDYGCLLNETIHALNCSHRYIPALPSTSDTGVPLGIKILDFSHNMIKCLPKINNTRTTCSIADCHVGCILELRLNYNKIDYLHKEAFLNLTCLTYLDLSNNFITNETLKRHHFFRLSHLRHLDLHGNPLHTLPDNVLISAHLSHLHTLNLSSCQLEKIGEVAIDDFFEMEILDLSNNKLSWLSGRTFQGLASLRILDLRKNRLQLIEKDTFADLRNLQELRLDHNRLTQISELAFHRQVGLKSLGLYLNRFTDIPFYALATLKELRSLDMSHNPIEVLKPGHVNTCVQELRMDYLEQLIHVKDDAFSAFPHLSSLSLRFCTRLTYLPPNAFRGSGSQVREVHLDHNGLQSLPRDLLAWHQLSVLTLHDNHWHCDCRLAWASDLNTSIRCEEPLKLRGQSIQSLTPDEMSCPRSLLGVQVVIGLSLTSLVLASIGLLCLQRQRRMVCWCLRGTSGSYVTVYTKDTGGLDQHNSLNGTCGEGEVDDLDLGTGEAGGRSEGGRVMILLNSFRHGYQRLKNNHGESSQSLIMADEV